MAIRDSHSILIPENAPESVNEEDIPLLVVAEPNPAANEVNEEVRAVGRQVSPATQQALAEATSEFLGYIRDSTPVIIILLTILLVEHFRSIMFLLTNVWVLGKNQARINEEALLKENRNKKMLLLCFVVATVMCCGILLPLFLDGRNGTIELYIFSFHSLAVKYPHFSIFSVFWYSILGGLCFRYFAQALEALCYVVFPLRLRHFIATIRMFGFITRSLAPMSVWCFFISSNMSINYVRDFLCFFYLGFKLFGFFRAGIQFVKSCQTLCFIKPLFGLYVTAAEGETCSICFNALEMPVKLDCSHIFCENCVNEWLDGHSTCPLCRATISYAALNIKNGSPDFGFLEMY